MIVFADTSALFALLVLDDYMHVRARAMQRLGAVMERSVSLTDCLSFEIMEARGITTAFAFDNHFARYGFEIANVQSP